MNKKINRVGQIYGRLTILSDSFKNDKGYFYKCICKCGNIQDIKQGALIRGQTKSCGCYNNRGTWFENQVFGKLTVVRWLGQISKGGAYECLCSCGEKCTREPRALHQSSSCDRCAYRFNGQKASKQQLKIRDLLNTGIINYKSGKYFIDIAMVYNGNKVAIEYDSWYWHKDNQEKDIIRDKFLLSQNWYILHIRSDEKLPSIEEINTKLYSLNEANPIDYITLDDWGK